MNRSGRPDPPRVLILAAGPEDLLREICAGIEEEGVPFEVVPGHPRPALALAAEAAQRSTLQVGVGLDEAGAIVVHHAKLPPSQPISRTDVPDWPTARRAGQDAARVVTGVPLTQDSSKESR